MMNSRLRQQGLSAIGFIIILLMIAFFTVVGLKLLPVYYENFKIHSVLKSLQDESDIARMSNPEIQEIIARRFRIDNIQRVTADEFRISRDRNSVVIDVDYEIRDTIFANVDVVVTFEDRIELPIR